MLRIPPIDPVEQIPVWDYVIALGRRNDPDDPRPNPEARDFRLVFTYRERQDSWYLSIYEPGPGDELVLTTAEDRPILTGVRLPADIFGQMYFYAFDEFPGGQFITVIDIDGDTDPEYEGFGTRWAVLHSDVLDLAYTTAEAAADAGVDVPALAADVPASVEVTP